jgi:hypothetical protein
MKKTFLLILMLLTIFFISNCAKSEPGGGELLKLTASDAKDVDWFGIAVAIDGDYLLVGASRADGGGRDRGLAYIYQRNQAGPDKWVVVKKITASDGRDEDHFGHKLSLSEDYALVGAFEAYAGGFERGAAYLYYRNQGGPDNWGEVKKLTASDGQDKDNFGHGVSVSGDFAIVGALLEDGAGDDRGAAYIYYRNKGGADNWGEVKKLTASDAGDEDNFGYTVALAGDYAIVGAYEENGDGDNRGAAYLYYRNKGGADNWGEVKKLTASDAEDFDDFGISVALAGDYALVGAHQENGDGENHGAAYLYYRNQGVPDNWGEVKKLTAGDAENSDWFGISVALAGDYALVGAMGEDGAGVDRGAAYIYYRNQGGSDSWGEAQKFTASDAEDNDWMCRSVAIAGDYVFAGAHLENGAGDDRGAVYIFKRR